MCQIDCMQVVILANSDQRKELAADNEALVWVQTPEAFNQYPDADVWIDLLFEDAATAHLGLLAPAIDKTIVVHAVTLQNEALPPNFVRINAWPTFLQGSLVEACGDGQLRQQVEAAFALLDKKVEWVPDVPGMVSARVIAAIINEAYFTLSEGIATQADIDTAMRLGTAYPYGPFAWSQKIGLQRVTGLLQVLAQEEPRYQPCGLLAEENQEIQ